MVTCKSHTGALSKPECDLSCGMVSAGCQHQATIPPITCEPGWAVGFWELYLRPDGDVLVPHDQGRVQWRTYDIVMDTLPCVLVSLTDHPKMASTFPCSPLEALWSWSFSPRGISRRFFFSYLHPIVPVPPSPWCVPLSISCLGAFAINQSQVHTWFHFGICNFSYWSLGLCPADLTLSPLL